MDPQMRTKILVVAVVAVASALGAQTSRPKSNGVTTVVGESWLSHLHRSFDETSMGKTGRLGPPLPEENIGSAVRLASFVEKEAITLHGTDLYRLNCRGCHGEAGLGAPPEINSVINPVRSGSAALVMERMRKVGMSMSQAEAAKLARQSHDALLQRLHNGGQDMPPFPYLNDREVRSLVAYLNELAEVPRAGATQSAVEETSARIGEQIVKSTCHVCHSASGPNPDPQQLADGAIPPLSTLASRVTQAQFIRKVTRGAPIVMGTPPLACRGRMPVFYYLSPEEAADAYLYLTLNPPYQWATLEPSIALSQAEAPPSGPGHPPQIVKAALSEGGPAKVGDNGGGVDTQFLAFLVIAGVLVSLLLVGGFGFTLHECIRLSAARDDYGIAGRQVAAQAADTASEPSEDRLVA